MVWSSSGDILATCSTYGTIRLWDTTHNDSWPLIQELQDETEEKIEEFYVMRFTPDDRHLFAAGKLKHRNRWSEEDDDNEVAPGPIKLFDVVSGKVIAKFENHTEEILCLKMVLFKEENYLLSASQDGYIIKWHFDSTWTKCLGTKRIDEVTTNMALGLSFLPNCGNKYFASAADEGIKIYDFENEVLLQRFDDLYTSYCDCIKFIRPRDFPEEDGVYYLITRGVELLSQDEPAKPLQNNTCQLRKLIAPKKACPAKDAFRLETVTTFQHESYKANSWPVRVASNGVYIAAPSVQGEVFIWHLKTGRLNCILAFHEDRECRDVTFHPTRPIVVSCCDDSTAKIYIQDPPYDDYQEEEEVEVDIEGGADVVVRQTPIVVDERDGSSSSASSSSSSSSSTSLERFHLSKSHGNGKSVGRKTRKKREEDEEENEEEEEEEIEEEEREEEEEEEEEGAQQRKAQATERMNVEGTPELEEAWGKLETQTANLEKAKKKLSEEKKRLNAEKKELAKERKELEEERRMFEKEKREFERAKREYEREQEKERIWLVERKKELEKGAE
ncbi:SH3 and multiple ankyrin repeat domains protein 1 isoform X1, variant 2 [Balamuthia mandrillaris]